MALAYGGSAAPDFVAEAAWGARAIIAADGTLDVPHDRTSHVGSDEAKARLTGLLKEHSPIKLAEEYLASHTVKQDEIVTILDGDDLVVKIRPAGGYLHLAAFLKEGL